MLESVLLSAQSINEVSRLNSTPSAQTRPRLQHLPDLDAPGLRASRLRWLSKLAQHLREVWRPLLVALRWRRAGPVAGPACRCTARAPRRSGTNCSSRDGRSAGVGQVLDMAEARLPAVGHFRFSKLHDDVGPLRGVGDDPRSLAARLGRQGQCWAAA